MATEADGLGRGLGVGTGGTLAGRGRATEAEGAVGVAATAVAGALGGEGGRAITLGIGRGSEGSRGATAADLEEVDFATRTHVPVPMSATTEAATATRGQRLRDVADEAVLVDIPCVVVGAESFFGAARVCTTSPIGPFGGRLDGCTVAASGSDGAAVAMTSRDGSAANSASGSGDVASPPQSSR